MAELSADQVEVVLTDCLFRDDEPQDDMIEVEGIQNRFGLHPKRVEDHRPEIEAMLDELPDNFRESEGGGWSFLNACRDRHGNQWTGLHQVMDHLFVLGMAIGKVECQIPRKLWGIAPGGMPYYVIHDGESERMSGHD